MSCRHRLDLLKVRSDSSAVDILDGARESLWRLRPIVFIAAKDAATLLDLADRLQEFGYGCYRMATPLFSSTNHNHRSSNIFGSETALALLAIPEEVEVSDSLDGCVVLAEGRDPPTKIPTQRNASDQDPALNPHASADGCEHRLLRFLHKLIR